MKFLYGILLTVVLLEAVVWAQSTNKIGTVLQQSLQRNGHANIIVSMKDGTQPILDKLSTMSFSNREERLEAVHDALTTHARNSQRKILSYLSSPPISKKYGFVQVKSLWISNQIGIRMANREFINRLAIMDEIFKIEEDAIVHLHEPTEIRKISDDILHYSPGTSSNWGLIPQVWGVPKIRAPDVWNAVGGTAGEGIIMGHVDTGCRTSHDAFQYCFEDDGYSWYDPVTNSSTPIDDHGHGTHSSATAVGYGTGVAQGAKLMCHKGLDKDGSGYSTVLIDCLQRFLCPTKLDGSSKDCGKSPHVISCSWGSDIGGYSGYDSTLRALQVATIIPVFSIGNAGSECNTAGSPGDRNDAYAVGSTGTTDALSTFSSRGSSLTTGITKPNCVAPGETIASAYYSADNAYAYMSGTSMACPHVAGLIALLISKDPTLTYDRIKLLIENNTVPITNSPAACNGTSNSVPPNNQSGWGRVDAKAAFDALVKQLENNEF